MATPEAGARLIIVCGLPGSGKTTLSKQLEIKLGAIRFCADEWLDELSVRLTEDSMRAKVEALQWKVAKDLLRGGCTVILEWGTWARCERDTLRLGARALGAAVELHYLSAPLAILYERLLGRGRESPPIAQEDLSRWSNFVANAGFRGDGALR